MVDGFHHVLLDFRVRWEVKYVLESELTRESRPTPALLRVTFLCGIFHVKKSVLIYVIIIPLF